MHAALDQHDRREGAVKRDGQRDGRGRLGLPNELVHQGREDMEPHPNEDPVWAGVKLVLRAIAASFPGPATTAAGWAELETQGRFSRIESFIQVLEEKIDSLRECAAPQPEVTDAHFVSLVRQVVERVSLESDRQKLNRYVQIVLHSIAPCRDAHRVLQQFFVELVHRLHDLHVRALQILHEHSPARLWHVETMFEGESTTTPSAEAAIAILSELLALGLAGRRAPHAENAHALLEDENNWMNDWKCSQYGLTDLGRRFLGFVTDQSSKGG